MTLLVPMIRSVEDGWGRLRRANPIVGFVDMNLKGAGQVFFQGNPVTGLLLLVGIFYGAIAAGDPEVAVGALVGLLVSTIVGVLLRTDDESLKMGLTGYNGILVGAALPTFLGATPMLWAYLVVASAASTVAFLAIANVFKTWGVPALTFPFNLVNWAFLLGAFQFLRLKTSGLATARLPSEIDPSAAHADVTAGFLYDGLFKNVAQVFLIDNSITGIIFVLALLASSAWVAGFTLLGSALALGACLALGAPAADIQSGLYGFNAVLTAIALGAVFYHPSVRVLIYTVLGVLTTVVIHATMVAGLAPVGLPTGTGPFVFATWLFLLPKRDFVPVHHKRLLSGVVTRTD